MPGRQEHGEETKDEGLAGRGGAAHSQRGGQPGSRHVARRGSPNHGLLARRRDAGRVAEKSRRQVACLCEGLRLQPAGTVTDLGVHHRASRHDQRRRLRLPDAGHAAGHGERGVD